MKLIFQFLIFGLSILWMRAERQYTEIGWPIHNCIVSHTENGLKPMCGLENIRLNETQIHFEPNIVEMIPEEVEGVNLSLGWGSLASRILVLSNDICRKFPNLKTIMGRDVKMEKIVDGAFERCIELEQIDLGSNQIQTLVDDVFKYNTKLKRINLSRNQLKHDDIPKILNGLPLLTSVHLGWNRIQEFPIEELTQNDNLEELHLQSNQFHDLDVAGITTKFPNLKKLSLCSSDVLRLGQANYNEIIEKLASKSVVLGWC